MGRTLSQSDSELCIEYCLRLTKGRIHMVNIAGAALLMLGVYALFLAVSIVPDQLVPSGLSAGARRLLLWGLLIAPETAIAALLVIRPLIRRLNDLHVARMIEKTHPDLRNDLTAALQLDRDSHVMRGCLSAIKRRAAREVFDVDVQASVATRWLRRAAAATGAVVLALAVYLVASGKNPWGSIARAHGVEAPWPTKTHIVLVRPEGGDVVVTGQPVAFAADIRHGDELVTLKISRDGQRVLADDTYNMAPSGESLHAGRRFEAVWPSAGAQGEQVVFQIASGDAVSPQYRLRVLPAPAIRRVNLTLDWPAYCGRGRQTPPGARVEALPDTRVSVEAELNLPVRSASLLFDKGDAKIMSISGRLMAAEFTVRRDDKYRIAYRGEHDLIRGESIRYEIKALEDRPPLVKLTDPPGDVQLALNETLRLAGEASDDFGISRIELVCQNDGGEKQSFLLREFVESSPASRPIDSSLPVSRLGQIGQRLTCFVQARDFRPMPDGTIGQLGRSRPFQLAITKPDEDVLAQQQAQSPDDPSRQDDPNKAGQ
ncbi:MAG TPA: DUF4175 family protein, partial [Phycisphaerae bacterium]|nr:DUF4175 family protein [Phycisphaerae bacterium]